MPWVYLERHRSWKEGETSVINLTSSRQATHITQHCRDQGVPIMRSANLEMEEIWYPGKDTSEDRCNQERAQSYFIHFLLSSNLSSFLSVSTKGFMLCLLNTTYSSVGKAETSFSRHFKQFDQRKSWFIDPNWPRTALKHSKLKTDVINLRGSSCGLQHLLWIFKWLLSELLFSVD